MICKLTKITSVIILILLLTNTMYAASGAGTEIFPFLKMGSSGRVLGMGGSFVAVSDDVNAILWNPGGLTQIEGSELCFTHLSYWQNINYEYLAYGQKIGNKGSIGMQVTYLNYGSIEKTMETSAGAYDTINSQGEYSPTDMGCSIAYGHKVSEIISLGMGIKYAIEKIDNDTVSGVGIDIGTLIKKNELGIGISVQNIGTKVGEDSLPLSMKAGVSYRCGLMSKNKNILISEETDISLNSKLVKTHIGAEAWVYDKFAIRGGYRIGYDQDSWTAGMGFRNMIGTLQTQIDYGYVPAKDLGDTHRITFTLLFGKK